MNIGWREGADRDTALCDTETTTLDVNYRKDSGETKNRNVTLHTVDLFKAKFRDLGIHIYGLKVPSEMEVAMRYELLTLL